MQSSVQKSLARIPAAQKEGIRVQQTSNDRNNRKRRRRYRRLPFYYTPNYLLCFHKQQGKMDGTHIQSMSPRFLLQSQNLSACGHKPFHSLYIIEIIKNDKYFTITIFLDFQKIGSYLRDLI